MKVNTRIRSGRLATNRNKKKLSVARSRGVVVRTRIRAGTKTQGDPN